MEAFLGIPNGDHTDDRPPDDRLDNVIPLKPRSSEIISNPETAPSHLVLKSIDHRADVSNDILDQRIEELLKPAFLNSFRQDDRVRAMVRTTLEIAEAKLPSQLVEEQWAILTADKARKTDLARRGKEDDFVPSFTPLGRKILDFERSISTWDTKAAAHLGALINEHGRAGAVMLLFEQTAAYNETLLMHTVDRIRANLGTTYRDEVIQTERLLRTMFVVDKPESITFSDEEMREIERQLDELLSQE